MSQPTINETQELTVNTAAITACEVDVPHPITCEAADLSSVVETTEVPPAESCTNAPAEVKEVKAVETEIPSNEVEAVEAVEGEAKKETPRKDEDESDDTAAANKRRRFEDTARDSTGCEERDAAATATAALTSADEELTKNVSASSTQEATDAAENPSQCA
ncbi:hypothetical protein LSM04_005179 [Trypanosoma melophagium]|uniref:uncharacterized protein n=1 Tax=Trypanosoma melophagium TaxID=715481 RepID=UPI00351A7BC5|nr:hypothetical protein LSM04_005179 [Trypanosoma melophagium]